MRICTSNAANSDERKQHDAAEIGSGEDRPLSRVNERGHVPKKIGQVATDIGSANELAPAAQNRRPNEEMEPPRLHWDDRTAEI